MPDAALKKAFRIQAQQERVVRRLTLIRSIADRYIATGRAYQRELDALIESMSPQDLAMYRATRAIERNQKK